MFDEDFKQFASLDEARKYWNDIQLNTLKKYFCVESDFALANKLSISRQYLSEVRSGKKTLSFLVLAPHVGKMDACTSLLIERSFTMTHLAQLYMYRR